MARPGRKRTWTLVALLVLVAGLAFSAAMALMWSEKESRNQRGDFRSVASSIAATLGTSLRRDADFVNTVRAVLTMEPTLTATQFDTWYTTLQGRERQVGSLGTAVVERIPASKLGRFLARRDRDPAFRSLVGTVIPVPRAGRSFYCLLAAGGAIVSLDSSTSGVVQSDWCDPTSPVGTSEFAFTRQATDSGQFVAFPAVALGVPTVLIEAPFYKLGAPLATVVQRRASSAGWVVSTFDVTGMITGAINGTQGLGLTLYHRNPGQGWAAVGHAGSAPSGDVWTYAANISVDGQWRVVIRGVHEAKGMTHDLGGMLLFGVGALASVLLFLLVLVLARSRDNALAMVAQKTCQLRHQALHDSLTGLANRALALDRAEQMLARARRRQVPMAALYIDIDGFKHINDTFGHGVGDEFLRITADRMRSVIREADTAARLSGDEFIVLLDGDGVESRPQVVAARLLEAVRQPCDLGAEETSSLSVTASIGIAYGLHQSAEALLADADVALYVAKAGGRNTSVVFESGMQTQAQDRLRLEMDLSEALADDQLFLVYQPTFDLRTEETVGVEALLRWQHPERGLIMPDAFISVAEESGLIVPIGRWVLEQACKQGGRWRDHGYELAISVNVSARQLAGSSLVEDVRHALKDSGLPPSALTLEITETTLVRHAQETVERLAAVKALGVRIAIDDFGTGYSSLAYLRHFPVDAIKIDRSFTWSISERSHSEAVIETLVRLGKTLHLETIAEGIEDETQLQALRRQECDHGQGFLYAHPLEADELDAFLRAHGHEALAG